MSTISVIIPVYNAEKTISRSVCSVQNQTFRDLEILVVDDGSTDNTGAILDELCLFDKRIKLIRIENHGEAHARNIGLEESFGEYIAFCDADDYMHPDMLEKMYNSLIESKADMTVCAWNYVDKNGEMLDWYNPRSGSHVYSTSEAMKDFLTSTRLEGFCWNKLVKKTLYVSNDIVFDERKISFCDMYANFQLICASDKVAYIGKPLYDYYQLDGACTHTVSLKKDYDYYDVLHRVEDTCTKMDLNLNGQAFTISRMSSHLFRMYKEKSQYNIKDFIKYFVMAYERYEKYPLFYKLSLVCRYPIECWIKGVTKVLIVALVYKYYKVRQKLDSSGH